SLSPHGCLYYGHGDLRVLHSFPTRRSSDLFVFSSAERDRFKRLDLRSNGGGGLKYRFRSGGRGRASLSAAALYSYEDFTPSASRSEEHTSELQSRENLVCRLLLEKKKTTIH